MNSTSVRPLCLFFVAGAVASAAEIDAAESIKGVTLNMLNAEVAATEPVRKCDFVAGEVPDNYADKPRYSKSAVAKFVKQTDEGKVPDASEPVKQPDDGGTSHATGEGKPQSETPPQTPAPEATPLSDADKAKGAAAWGQNRS